MTFSANELIEKMNAYLASMPYMRSPEGLYEPIKYELSLGGKRLRPVLMLMAYNLYKEEVDAILPQAAGLETYHNHTLLHDDLMDNADMRRNQPTVHKKWNANTAILSGDAMLLLASRLMGQCDDAHLPAVMKTFTETAIEICEGQQWDMEFETRSDVTVPEYIEMIRLKTSVLLAAALKIGAIMGDAPAEDTELLYQFGVKMGLAFQLQDDFLDVYGDPKVFGKNIGGDIMCNKKTFMLITAHNLANETQRQELERWIHAENPSAEEKIHAVTEIYNELSIGDLCNKEINTLYEEGLELLEKVNLPAEKKEPLRLFACRLMNRKL